MLYVKSDSEVLYVKSYPNGNQLYMVNNSANQFPNVCLFLPKLPLTHWGRVIQIWVSKLNIIGLDNGLSPGRCQDVIWTNAGSLSIGPKLRWDHGNTYEYIVCNCTALSIWIYVIHSYTPLQIMSSLCYTCDVPSNAPSHYMSWILHTQWGHLLLCLTKCIFVAQFSDLQWDIQCHCVLFI